MNNFMRFLCAVLFFIGLISGAALINSKIFFKSPDFKRVVSDWGKKTVLSKEQKRVILNYTDSRNSDYYRVKNLTLKGSFVMLRKEIKKTEFKPGLKGDYQYLCRISLKPGTRIIVRLFKSGQRIDSHVLKKKGILKLTGSLNLDADDTIGLSIQGSGNAIVGDFLFMRNIKKEKKSFVFLICADTLRADHIPLYGYQRNTAPGITTFSRDAVTFDRAYSQSSWTLPAHMSLFTSLYEFNHGIKKNNRLKKDIPFLMETLSEHFYTAAINGNLFLSAMHGFYRGFDMYTSSLQDPKISSGAQILFKKAENDIEKCQALRAFYFLHTYQIHNPYCPHLRSLGFFCKNFSETRLFTPAHRDQYKPLLPEMRRKYVDYYDAGIHTFDMWFGRFLDFLKEKRIYNDSLIVLFADHGEEFFEHSGWEHCHSLYNEMIHVPLIVKFPKNRNAGRHVKLPVGLIDIMPTIMECCNIECGNSEFDGISLIPLIEEKKKREGPLLSTQTNSRFLDCFPFRVAVIEDDTKIIFNQPYGKKALEYFAHPPPDIPDIEFFQLNEDPGEKNNLFKYNRNRAGKWKRLVRAIMKKGMINLKGFPEKARRSRKEREAMRTLGYL